MNTLQQIRDLTTLYVDALREGGTGSEDDFHRAMQEARRLLAEGADVLRWSDPAVFQWGWFRTVADNEAQTLKQSLRRAAQDRYTMSVLPTGLTLADIVICEEGWRQQLASPAYVSWQDKNNACPHFIIHYPKEQEAAAKERMGGLLLNMLLTLAPGRLRMTFCDCALSGVADVFSTSLPAALYHDTIVTDNTAMSQRLAMLLDRSSAVISKYGNLPDYASAHQRLPVPYEVVVLAGYPDGYENYTEQLLPLIRSGARSGMYFILLHNTTAMPPDGQGVPLLDEVCWHEIALEDHVEGDETVIAHTPFYAHPTLRPLCLEYIAEESQKKRRGLTVKMDFGKMTESPYVPQGSELSVDIGVNVDNLRPVQLRFNTRDFIHTFILGQSGSGKSVLLNNIITQAILLYPPSSLMLYLLDFKGVEFNRYKGLKHTKAVLTDNSDPQMTLEVLRELRDENKRRIKLWQNEGVNNMDAYNARHPATPLPTILFVADECQVMFAQPSAVGAWREEQREIAEILSVIATQGRSQGIHMLLATQQLDETDIPGQVLKNLTECILLNCAPSDAERLVPDSGPQVTGQPTGQCCYYHKKELVERVQSYYADDDTLFRVIRAAQDKAKDERGHGAAYFCGTQRLFLDQSASASVSSLTSRDITMLLGRNIGLADEPLQISLPCDYAENVLLFGANREGQTLGVAMAALLTMIVHSVETGMCASFIVIDCYVDTGQAYKRQLSQLSDRGLCRVVDHRQSGTELRCLAGDVMEGTAVPTVLCIFGHERFSEMKRDLPLADCEVKPFTAPADSMQIEPLSFGELPSLDGHDKSSKQLPDTYQKALRYILEEGPMQNVHILLQVDKPGNILYEGDYGQNATDKFRHKVMLRSENKYVQPLRLSKDIDVEALSDDETRRRAYYYPDDGFPQLFTPYLPPNDISITDNLQNR